MANMDTTSIDFIIKKDEAGHESNIDEHGLVKDEDAEG